MWTQVAVVNHIPCPRLVQKPVSKSKCRQEHQHNARRKEAVVDHVSRFSVVSKEIRMLIQIKAMCVAEPES